MYQIVEIVVDILGTELALFACALLVYLVFSRKIVGQPASVSSPRTTAWKRNRMHHGFEGGRGLKVPTQHVLEMPTRASTSVPKAKTQHQDTRDLFSRATEIRSLGKAHSIEEAVALFDSSLPLIELAVEASPGNRSVALLFNSILEACVECGQLSQALFYLDKARTMKCADGVSFNIVIKGHLAASDEVSARQLLDELLTSGSAATTSSFHGLLSARVNCGDNRGAWQVLDEMRSAGVAPNLATCSIMLRVVQSAKNYDDLQRILKLLSCMKESPDEGLMSSLVEACLNCKRLDILSKIIFEHRRKSDSAPFSTVIYGSMMKAFGQARDVAQVKSLWQDMRIRGVQPSAITFGCMIEALVANRNADDAWELVQTTWDDEAQRPLLNTIVFSTVLKGFASQAKKTMEIYEIMRERGIPCNTITYNTILNTFAQSGAMDRIAGLLEDMRTSDPPAEPDLVTYSTLVKCFCSAGDVSKALDLFAEMKKAGKYSPDEMMYNSLLDGCAKTQRVSDALRLLRDMRSSSVTPSNYTLTMIVKLLGRCKRLDQAFSMVDELAKEHKLKLNIHVYTCLIQACFQNKQPQRAVSLLDRLQNEGVTADQKTFGALIRGCLQAGQIDRAAEIARRAFVGAHPAGLEARDLEELTRRLGASSSAAQAIRAAAAGPPQRSVSTKGSTKAGAQAMPPWRRSKSTCKNDSGSDTGGSTTDPGDESSSN